MKRETVTTLSAPETLNFAKEFSRRIQPGDVIRLEGDLGAGKTTFVKGIALGLGLKSADEVKSPTFVIMHIYQARMPLYHFDLYRLEEGKELETIGLEDFMHDPEAVTCVEWAERAAGLFPEASFTVQFRISDENVRTITVTSPD